MENSTAPSAVTLDAFAERVGCHFTTASRLKSGERLPGRELLGRIIDAYDLDVQEAMRIYTSGGDARQKFGQYLCDHVFVPAKTEETESR